MAFNANLGREFTFDEADLDANRAGHLSADQEIIFRNTAEVMRRRTPRVKVLLAVVFAGAIAVVAYGISVTPGGGTTAGIVAAVILAWIGALFFWAMGRNRRYQAAMERRELITVEGEVSFDNVAFDEGMGGSMYVLKVERHKLSVTSSQMDAMTDGARYRVHYVESGIGRPAPLTLERVEA